MEVFFQALHLLLKHIKLFCDHSNGHGGFAQAWTR
jgi:hypothetical protein